MSMSEPEPQHGLIAHMFRRGGRYLILDMALNIVIPYALISGVSSVIFAVLDRSAGWALFSLVGFFGSVAGLLLSRTITLEARRRIQPIIGSVTELPARSSVLYLRSFKIDEEFANLHPFFKEDTWRTFGRLIGVGNRYKIESTIEEEFFHYFSRFGRFVAVGNPGELYPRLGASRFYLRKDDWKPDVRRLMRRARLVIFVAGLGKTESAEGVIWEFAEAVRILPPSRVILLVCTPSSAYNRFRGAVATEFARRRGRSSAELPHEPRLPKCPSFQGSRPTWSPPLYGIIRFDDNWTSEFVLFDQAQKPRPAHRIRRRAAVRAEIDNLMRRVDARLYGNVIHPSRWVHTSTYGAIFVAVGFYSVHLVLSSTNGTAVERVLNLLLVTLPILGGIRSFVSGQRYVELCNGKIVDP